MAGGGLLDGGLEWRGGEEEDALNKNRAGYEDLKRRGLDASFTSSTAQMHAKAVVFDGETLLLGSTNWTEAAFSRNFEANLLVRDPAAARETLAHIRSAGRRRLPKEEATARLPIAFLTKRYAGEISRQGEDRAFALSTRTGTPR